MKKLRFMDNITTSARWKSDALDNVVEKPKLKRWQTAGVIAATAVAMASVAVMPMMFKGNAPKTAVGSLPDAETTAEEDVSETETIVRDPIDPEKFGRYKNVVGKIKNDFDFLEIVTVLDCEYTEDGDILLAAAADNGVKRLFCTTISASSADYSEDDFGSLSFGDKLVLGYQTESKENMSVEMLVNDSAYSSKQPMGTSECFGFAYLGDSYEGMFNDVLHSAGIVTGAPYNGYNNDTVKLVQSHYRNMGKVTPCYTTNKMWRAPYYNYTGFYMSCLDTLYDDNYTVDGVASHLYVVELAAYNGDGIYDDIENASGEISLYRDGDSGEYMLNICGGEYGVYVSGDSDIEVLDIRLTKDVSLENTYYLLVNAIDAKHTGNIYDNLDISVYSEAQEAAREDIPDSVEVAISSVNTDGDELSCADITPSDTVDVSINGIAIFRNGEKAEIYESRYYTFEITPAEPAENISVESTNNPDTLGISFDDRDELLILKNENGHDIISVMPYPEVNDDGSFKLVVVVHLRRSAEDEFGGESFRFMEIKGTSGTATVQTISFEGEYIK